MRVCSVTVCSVRMVVRVCSVRMVVTVCSTRMVVRNERRVEPEEKMTNQMMVGEAVTQDEHILNVRSPAYTQIYKSYKMYLQLVIS